MALQFHPPPSSMAVVVNNGTTFSELRKRPREDSSASTSGLHHNPAEVDALTRHECERMTSRFEEVRKRHRAALLSEVSRQVSRRLQEKEAELEKARRRTAELEVKLRQVGAEGRMWFMVAKNSEAVTVALRATLEQVLLQNAAAAAANTPAEEGSGDTDEDDAQSFCFGQKEAAAAKEAAPLALRRRCRTCGEREACVVMFPCRHLCLCRACQSSVDSCPACGSPHRACFEVFLP